MAIKKIKPKSPDPYLGKTIGDNTLARIAHVNQLVDQINNNSTYKVYTALLTQGGASDNLQINSGDLTIGVTYEINDDSGNPDWTNVGALNNNGGTFFVATGTTPNSWGNSGASLIYNTGAPVVTVLENTIGNIWFTYVGAGNYIINSNSLFTTNKTTIFGSQYNAYINVYIHFNTNGLSINEIPIRTGDPADADSILYNTPIEIRVYN